MCRNPACRQAQNAEILHCVGCERPPSLVAVSEQKGNLDAAKSRAGRAHASDAAGYAEEAALKPSASSTGRPYVLPR